MIEVKNLTKRYNKFSAVKNISFKIAKGEIVGFLGPNGAGKTTTMKIISCFMPCTEGEVVIDGLNISEDSFEIRKKIGYLPENIPLYPEISIQDYLKFIGKIKGVDNKKINSRIEEVMSICGIIDVRKKLCGRLSKGYKQRVGFAQAIIHNPPILILDEPTIGLDPKQIIEMRNLIKSLAGTHTIILSTHILPEVSMTCDRVIIINEGSIAAIDTPENLTSQLNISSQIFIQIKGDEDKVKEIFKTIPEISMVELKDKSNEKLSFIIDCVKGVDIRDKIVKKLVEENISIFEIKYMDVSLEEIFLKIIMQEAV
ncbi:MAG: ABC transporter ATP-binding protein [bacterium]